jgi:hypothetical protein
VRKIRIVACPGAGQCPSTSCAHRAPHEYNTVLCESPCWRLVDAGISGHCAPAPRVAKPKAIDKIREARTAARAAWTDVLRARRDLSRAEKAHERAVRRAARAEGYLRGNNSEA